MVKQQTITTRTTTQETINCQIHYEQNYDSISRPPIYVTWLVAYKLPASACCATASLKFCLQSDLLPQVKMSTAKPILGYFKVAWRFD